MININQKVNSMKTKFLRYLFLLVLNLYLNTFSINFKCDWSWIIEDLEAMVKALDNKAINLARDHYAQDQYCSQLANIRKSNDFCNDEINFCNARLLKIKSALEKLLDKQIDPKKLPKIAIASSGGGYRSMLNLLGSLWAMKATGLLDSILYMSGVSGSTWLMAPWIQSGKSLEELRNFLTQQIQTNFITYNLNYEYVTSQLFCKWLFNQPYSLTDVYGMMLGQQLLGICDSSTPLNLAYQSKLIEGGNCPMPIYSSVIRSKGYQWLEFTPFEVGSEYLNSFIPTWAFGRPFDNGRSIIFGDKYSPALPLDFCLGTWASAFAYLLANPEVQAIVKQNTENGIAEDALSARVCNWNYNVPGTTLFDQPNLELADAGIFINYDLNSLLRRNVDIIIILDASTNWRDVTQLQQAEKYWRQFYKLPPFDYSKILGNVCTVFKDTADTTLPTIIYVPQIKNPAVLKDPQNCLNNYCNTFNFVYTPEQSQAIIDNALLNMIDSNQVILDEIKYKINSKP